MEYYYGRIENRSIWPTISEQVIKTAANDAHGIEHVCVTTRRIGVLFVPLYRRGNDYCEPRYYAV